MTKQIETATELTEVCRVEVGHCTQADLDDEARRVAYARQMIAAYSSKRIAKS